jgi:hypothetical protein
MEWMAADASVIFVGIVTDVSLASPSGATVTVQETIKGNLLPGAKIAFESMARDQRVPGERALFFLDESKLSVLIGYEARVGRSAIVLNSPQAIRMDRTVLTKSQEIIDAVRSASKFEVDRTRKPIRIPCSGGGTLVVPADERIEKLAQTWAASNSLDDRVTALRALHGFKSKQNIAIAQRLLGDARMRRGQGKWQTGYYPVRGEAHDLLVDWSIPHPYVPLVGAAYAYERLEFSPATFLWPAGAGLLMAVLAIVCRYGHQVLFPSTMVIFCVAAVGCLSWFWIRSSSRVDELMFRVGENHHELASYRGGLQYQVVREWTLPPKTVWGSFDLKSQDDVWSADALQTVVDRRLAGFMSGHGQIPGPAGAIHSYKLLRLPYWTLMLPFAIVLVYEAYLVRRQLRRRRLGLCRNCGYDLRESHAGICPECGNQTPTNSGSPSLPGLEAGNEMPIGGHAVGV